MGELRCRRDFMLRSSAGNAASWVSLASTIVSMLRCLSESAIFPLFRFCNLAEGTRRCYCVARRVETLERERG